MKEEKILENKIVLFETEDKSITLPVSLVKTKRRKQGWNTE